MAIRKSIADRFWAKVDKSAGGSGCWVWTAARGVKGYGCLRVAGRTRTASRLAYELEHGAVLGPREYVLHSCDNRACVNPAHLRVGTASDNTRDAFERKRTWQPNRTHCPYGHPYDEENTRHYAGRRHCRACSRRTSLTYWRIKTGKIPAPSEGLEGSR